MPAMIRHSLGLHIPGTEEWPFEWLVTIPSYRGGGGKVDKLIGEGQAGLTTAIFGYPDEQISCVGSLKGSKLITSLHC